MGGRASRFWWRLWRFVRFRPEPRLEIR